MLLNGRIDGEDYDPDGLPSRGWLIAVVVCTLPLYVVGLCFGEEGRGTVAGCLVITFAVLIRLNARLYEGIGFWSVVSMLAIAHVLALIYLPIPNKNFVFPIVAPIGIVDYLAMVGILRLMPKARKKETND